MEGQTCCGLHARGLKVFGDRSNRFAPRRAGAHLTAATPNAEAQTVTERLSLVGQAWFEAGQFDAASDCYLAAVRRLVANP